jgi:predicted permease
MILFNALAPIFSLILIGALLRQLKFPGDEYWPGIERLIYYVLFPAMLIHQLSRADLTGGLVLSFTLILALSLLLISALLVLVQFWRHQQSPQFTSLYQGSTRFNSYIALAVASSVFEPSVFAIAALALGINIVLVNISCTLAFSMTNPKLSLSPWRFSQELITNPLIVGCIIGLGINLLPLQLPTWTLETFRLLGATALPLGLIAVGVALRLRRMQAQWSLIVGSSGLKFLVLPALLWGLSVAFGLPPTQQAILVLIGAMPTATSGYILARQLGGDAELMANIITFQSLAAFVMIPAWLWWLL